tara:strand:+ start:2666 stop:2839 length:174 start_codon:yes stop_codon:yes gene_type:complete
MGKYITIGGLEYIFMTRGRYLKIQTLVGDLTWDADKLSDGGQKTLNNLCNVLDEAIV